MKFWDHYPSFKEAEEAWEEGARAKKDAHPLKVLSHLPHMPGIAPDTKRGLKWKSLKYLIQHDEKRLIPRHFLRHPLKYSMRLIKSLCKKESFKRDSDFFFYGLSDEAAFKRIAALPHAHILVGFSYCHKPLECPSGRFTDACLHDPENPVCRQCFIGKAAHALPAKVKLLFIPTVHYIGEKLFEAIEQHPDKQLLFLITACEMTLKMFGDWGNMLAAPGIGVRLDGRICNTMRAFELSERGVKPGLTVVLKETQRRMLDLIASLHEPS